jgi:hypothetical protein
MPLIAVNYKSILYAKLTILIVNLAVKHFPLSQSGERYGGLLEQDGIPWQE